MMEQVLRIERNTRQIILSISTEITVSTKITLKTTGCFFFQIHGNSKDTVENDRKAIYLHPIFLIIICIYIIPMHLKINPVVFRYQEVFHPRLLSSSLFSIC